MRRLEEWLEKHLGLRITIALLLIITGAVIAKTRVWGDLASYIIFSLLFLLAFFLFTPEINEIITGKNKK